jgi:hypothetical protein
MGKHGTQAARYGRVAWNFQRSAAIDGHAQVPKERNASWARVDMLAHCFAGNGFYSAI